MQLDFKRLNTLWIQRRTVFLGCVFGVLWVSLVYRLYQLSHYPIRLKQSAKQSITRGKILDRHGVILAQNVLAYHVFAHPFLIQDPKKTASVLAAFLYPDHAESMSEKLYRQFTSDQKFVWIYKGLPANQKEPLMSHGLAGIDVLPASRRVYPQGALCSHVIGYVGQDAESDPSEEQEKGVMGIEWIEDATLREGESVQISLDTRIQLAVSQALEEALEAFDAPGGNAMVADYETGQLLAMVSWPRFDPHAPKNPQDPAFFNRNLQGIYDHGSIFKMFTTAMALENGVSLEDSYDSRQPLKIGRFTITDFMAKNRVMTVRELFLHSSNIGTAKMALELGQSVQQNFLKRIGLLDPLFLDQYKCPQPLIPKPWGSASVVSISYGYLGVTPLHCMQAAMRVTTDHFRPLTWRLDTLRQPETPVISTKTRLALQEIMREAAGKARVKGYDVGGKSGTANLLKGGKYQEGKNRTSFFAFFRPESPGSRLYAILVSLEEPKPNERSRGFASGGWIAAPVVAQIIQTIGPLLDMRSDLEPPCVETNLDQPKTPFTRLPPPISISTSPKTVSESVRQLLESTRS